MVVTRLAPFVLVLCGCVVEHEVGQVVAANGDSSSITATGPFDPDGSEVSTAETSTTGTTSGLTDVSATMSTEGGVDTATDGTFGGSSEVSTGGGDPYAACGVTLEFGGPQGQWQCSCATCDFVQNDLTPQSRAEFLGACACLCEAAGCGEATTAESTSGGDSSGGSTDDTTTTAASESSSGSESSTG